MSYNLKYWNEFKNYFDETIVITSYSIHYTKLYEVLGTVKKGFFGKKVNHPGFAGDSYLYWALKNVDTEKRGREVAKELLNGIT